MVRLPLVMEVGISDGGRAVGRAILPSRVYGVVASCAVRKEDEIGLEDRRGANSDSYLALGLPHPEGAGHLRTYPLPC